ncbi:MAG: aspartate/tyrosine/aromatic aminotransferase [Burkholderiales bacterium]|nr:aspartate/tyrosine/aromatic aminotransferase [Burkholderiales bacterium]
MTSYSLASIEMAPRDPILGLTEAFNADPNPAKVNLGQGVYVDDTGKVPVLECVRRAELALAERARPRSYLPIDGLAAYDRLAQEMLLGADHVALRDRRVVTVQSLGGTGALKIGADFLRRAEPQAQVWISDPSWENHRALFEYAGFTVNTYPYYDPTSHGCRFDDMLAALAQLPAGSIVVLHACCHNPTGVDLTPAQWQRVLEVVQHRALVPFLDIAYQGFGDGLEQDAYAVRLFAAALPAVFAAGSYSKSLSLYGERVGALSVVTGAADEAARVLSQLKRIIRTNYSNPPTHGGEIAALVLSDPELRLLWEQELGGMRERIKLMRRLLVEKIREQRADFDFSYVLDQRGMFSYSGLSKEQVHALREKHAIYAVDSGRVCVASLSTVNVDYVARSIAQVLVTTR